MQRQRIFNVATEQTAQALERYISRPDMKALLSVSEFNNLFQLSDKLSDWLKIILDFICISCTMCC